MKSGICPKCSSKRIIRHRVVYIVARDDGPSDGRLGSMLNATFYTCVECAFSECYSEDVSKLVKMADGEPYNDVQAEWLNPDQSPYR